MKDYLEIDFEPNQTQQSLIDFILGRDFPWYFGCATSTDKDYKLFTHFLMHRADDLKQESGIVNSNFYEPLKDIFVDICKNNNVEVNTVYRGALYNSYHNPKEFGEIHIDHDFPYKHFIWYLNDFTGAPTYLFDDNNNVIKATAVGKNKIVIFPNVKHAQGFCAPFENRITLVFTFN